MSSGPAESRVLRATRWRLVAWSGGLTLAVLLVLGATIYFSVTRFMAEEARDVLERRAALMAPIIVVGGVQQGPISIAFDEATAGVTFLGPASGSLALIVSPGGLVSGIPGPLVRTLGLPDDAGVDAAKAGTTDVRDGEVAGRRVRILSLPVETEEGTYVVQVLQDIAAEERALAALRTVLLVGGLAVLAAALLLGWFYAGRALVPIRESMRRQREFAADAGHELRTPLAVVMAAVEDAGRSPGGGRVASPLDEIERQADRLTELVDELLVFARMEAGTIELERTPVRLDEAVVAATERLTLLARGADVSLEASPRPVTVVGDRRRLEQLIGILADNAIRHSPSGGTVRIGLEDVDRSAVLTVDDDGPGIPHDELPRVFDRFYRARTATMGGVGLGLAIARWVAEGHGGSVAAENRPGGGARFIVSLPTD
jgi:two-component system sensor histidine kinase CiaH